MESEQIRFPYKKMSSTGATIFKCMQHYSTPTIPTQKLTVHVVKKSAQSQSKHNPFFNKHHIKKMPLEYFNYKPLPRESVAIIGDDDQDVCYTAPSIFENGTDIANDTLIMKNDIFFKLCTDRHHQKKSLQLSPESEADMQLEIKLANVITEEIEDSLLSAINLKPVTKQELAVRKVILPIAVHPRTLILDLDETLIHTLQTSSIYSTYKGSVVASVKYYSKPSGTLILIQVIQRPYLIEFLKHMALLYDIVVNSSCRYSPRQRRSMPRV